MKTPQKHALGLCVLTAVVLAVGSIAATAATYPISWLDMSPTPYGSPLPSGSPINVPGIGIVTVTHSIPAHWSHSRLQQVPFIVGSVTAGPDTWSWMNYEFFSTIFTPGELGPEVGTITYTFPGTLPAGVVYVGTVGLGATTSFGGGTSTTTVNQNGTYLGEFIGDPTAGPTQFVPGAGTFTLQNAVTGAGGANPWWNTNLGVVRIDDAVSSLTIIQSQVRGDGIGVNIGFVLDGVVSNEDSTWGGVKSLFR